MAVSVNGFPLEFTAVVNTDSFDVSIQQINKKLNAVSAESVNLAKSQQQEIKNFIKGISDSLKESNAAVNTTALTWKEFVGQRMGAYMKEFGGHGPAIKKIAEEWKAYKESLKGVSDQTASTASKISVSFTKIADARNVIIPALKETTQEIKSTFDQSKKELEDYLSTIQQMKSEGLPVAINQRAVPTSGDNKPKAPAINIDADSLQTLNQAKQVFRDMDAETQMFIKELVELELQLEEVKKAQKALDDQRAKGDITAKKYVEATQALAAQEKNIGQSISIIGQRQKEYEASLEPVVEKTVSAQKRLSELKREMASNPNSPAFQEWTREAAELQAGINRANQELKTAVALQTLQNRQATINSALIGETDVSKVKAYKKELATIGADITKLGNAGKIGFDDLGNAIGKTAVKTNVLSKGFGFLRQAAYLIPGVGMAGIFNLIGEAVIGLIGQLVKGGDAFDSIGQKIKLFNEVNADAAKSSASQITNLKLLYSAATDVTKTIKERTAAVIGLKNEFPDTFANIRNEIILNGQARQSYLDLIPAIQAASRAKAVKDKLDEIEAQRFEVAMQKQKIVNATDQEKAQAKDETFVINTGGSFSQGTTNQSVKQTKAQAQAIIEARKQEALKEQDIRDKRLENQAKFLIQFAGGEQKLVQTITGTTDASKKRSLAVIDAEIANQKKLQSSQSVTREQYLSYQKEIDKLEKERISITGASKSQTKTTLAEENKLLSKRFQILQDIQGLQRDATQSGLDDEASALDKINEKYDKAKEKALEFNKLAEAHNKTSSKQVSLIDTSAIDTARAEETTNQRLKDEAARFKDNLEVQKAIFAQYEEAKKNIGIEKANLMFEAQRKGFTSYEDYLKEQVKQNLPAIGQSLIGLGGLLNIGDRQKVKALFAEVKAFSKDQKEENAKNLLDVLKKTTDFGEARKLIELQYNKDVKTLEENQTLFTKEELEKRKALLIQNKEQELQELNNQAVRQSEIYRLMGQDLILSSKDKLKSISKEITKTLQQGFLIDAKGAKIALTPEMIANLTTGKERIDAMLDDTKKISNIFRSLSGFAQNFNEEISVALETLGNMVDAAKSVKDNLEAFKAAGNKEGGADVLGQLGAVVGIAGAIGGVIGGLFSKSAEESKRRTQEIKNLQAKVYAGEFEINSLYRERELTQIRLNDLRLQGAQQELEVLKKQKEQIQNDTAELLKKLQQQTFTGTQEQIADFIKNSPNLSTFQIQKVLSDRQLSLSGKTFAELEKLDTFGQLEGTAKTLFDTLAKLKQEGVDVEQAIKDLKLQLKIDLTAGATKEGIADSIAEGFAQGKKSAADFADTFQDLMKKAALAALKIRFLDEPLKKFIDQFQEAVTSGDTLTSGEVSNLQKFYETIITNASKQFDQIQQVAGLDFNSPTANANSLQGAVKNITEESAQLLAGQFGGLRMTVAEGLAIAKQQLDKLNAIQFNTGATVDRIERLETTLINFYRVEGVKLK